MLEKLHAGGVRKVFCGHYHRNAGGWYKVSLRNMLTLLTKATWVTLSSAVYIKFCD